MIPCKVNELAKPGARNHYAEPLHKDQGLAELSNGVAEASGTTQHFRCVSLM